MSDILTELYDNNISSAKGMRLYETLQQNFGLTWRLSEWLRAVPLDLRPGNVFEKQHKRQPPILTRRLRTNLSLCYFGTCLLVHRPVLLKFLDFQRDSLDAEQDLALLRGAGSLSLRQGVEICGECILVAKNIVSEINNGTNLLGAWWYTTFYSKNESHYWNISCWRLLTQPNQNSFQRIIDNLRCPLDFDRTYLHGSLQHRRRKGYALKSWERSRAANLSRPRQPDDLTLP